MRFVRGAGRFLDDLGDGALEARFVRSAHAHALVTGIDTRAARCAPGVVAVFTAADLEGRFAEPMAIVYPHPSIRAARTPPPLAGDEAVYAGQPLAMVVAASRELADDAVELVAVSYEPLPVAIDLEAAAAGAQGPAHRDMEDNLAAVHRDEVGDVEAALARAAHIIERRFVCERASGSPLEGRGVLAHHDRDGGRLVVTDTTQVPHSVRRFLAERFALPPEDVEVRVPDVGGGFGTKGFRLYPEELLVPWAAWRLGRPVKWVEGRSEHFLASSHLRSQIHDVTIGFDSSGRIDALGVRYLHDLGAGCQMGLLVPIVSGTTLPGPYRIPNLRYELRAVYTNTVQTAPYRGAGIPFGTFVIERAMDAVACHLGLDRAEVRRRNLIPREAFPYDTGLAVPLGRGTVVYDSGDYEAGLDAALEAIGYAGFEEERRRALAEGRRLGLGLACYVESGGVGPYESAHVEVLTDGTVTVSTGAASTGQGHETVFASLAAGELGVAPERVTVARAGTRRVAFGSGTYGSRSAVVAGTAVVRAARAVREKALRLASRMLEAAPEDMEVAGGMVRVKGTAKAVPLAAVAAASAFGPPPPGETAGLSAVETFAPKGPTYSSGTHACVVEVDGETFDVRILRYVVQHDCGTVLNQAIVDGQVVGGVAHGIGEALYERREYDGEGQLRNASFLEYLVPMAPEVPDVELRQGVTPAPGNELGAKGAGESGIIPVAATIVSALEAALGVPINTTPQSPLSLFELMLEQR